MRMTEAETETGRRSRPPLTIGIGLHCGHEPAGNIGSAERMEYTVMGDTVTLASRVATLGKDIYLSAKCR
jgi:adenylate cyclase